MSLVCAERNCVESDGCLVALAVERQTECLEVGVVGVEVTADVEEVEVVVVASRKNSALLAGFHIVECPSSAHLTSSACLFFGLPAAEIKQLLAVGRELLAYTERRLLVRECGEIAVGSP